MMEHVMKKVILSLLVFGGIIGFAASGKATSYRDVDVVNRNLTASSPSYTGNLNIKTSDGGIGDLTGYDSNNEAITSAYALFTILNVSLGTQSAMRIDIDGGQWLPNTAVPLGLTFWGGTIGGSILADGNAEYTITRTAGTVRLISAALFVETGPKALVPDAGMTLSLLGFGILGLGFFRRKLA